MPGWTAAAELIDNVVNFVDIGYHQLLVVTTLRKDVDDTLAEIEGVMESAKELVKDHKVLIAPEDYARFFAKHRGYHLDVSYERERSPSPPNRSRRARVAALYEVARSHRRDALTIVRRAVSEIALSSPFDEPPSKTPPETPPKGEGVRTIGYLSSKWSTLWSLGLGSVACLTLTIGLALFKGFGAQAGAHISRTIVVARVSSGGG
ncbi:hypothetical protein FRC06_005775 [Ceratobasidium sp. 370]|nr:hypothetical protein FRC06_005775 [Ceratobasidium sp. 370]